MVLWGMDCLVHQHTDCCYLQLSIGVCSIYICGCYQNTWQESNIHYMIHEGSFRLLTSSLSSNFSFFLLGKVVRTCLKLSCVGRISHHGESNAVLNNTQSNWHKLEKRIKKNTHTYTGWPKKVSHFGSIIKNPPQGYIFHQI